MGFDLPDCPLQTGFHLGLPGFVQADFHLTPQAHGVTGDQVLGGRVDHEFSTRVGQAQECRDSFALSDGIGAKPFVSDNGKVQPWHVSSRGQYSIVLSHTPASLFDWFAAMSAPRIDNAAEVPHEQHGSCQVE